jgi:hypothetical protein
VSIRPACAALRSWSRFKPSMDAERYLPERLDTIVTSA